MGLRGRPSPEVWLLWAAVSQEGRWSALSLRLELSKALSSQVPDSFTSQLRSQVCPTQLTHGHRPGSALLCPSCAPFPTACPPQRGLPAEKMGIFGAMK